MGTDIHWLIERRVVANRWEAIPPPAYPDALYDRNYEFFGMLAGVRRTDLPHITGAQTGFPPDFPLTDTDKDWTIPTVSSPLVSSEYEGRWYVYGGEPGLWMGYHDPGWILLSDLLAWPGWDTPTTHEGYMPYTAWLDWHRGARDEPDEYCGDVWGDNVIKLTEREARTRDPKTVDATKDTYVLVTWTISARAAARDRLFKALQKLAKLDPGHPENIRLTYAFDS